jgi:hypothetical protein
MNFSAHGPVFVRTRKLLSARINQQPARVKFSSHEMKIVGLEVFGRPHDYLTFFTFSQRNVFADFKTASVT